MLERRLHELTHELEGLKKQFDKRQKRVRRDVGSKAQAQLHSLTQEVESLRAQLDEQQKQVRRDVAKRIEPQEPQQESAPLADTGAFIVGALLGGLIGAGLAMWFAPQSGEETRHDIRERGLEIRAEAEQAANEARMKIEGPKPETLIAEAKAAARQYRDEVTG